MLSTGKTQKPLKAKLIMYLFTRKFGKKEGGNLIHHILFANERIGGLGFSRARKSWGFICKFSHKNDFVFGNVDA